MNLNTRKGSAIVSGQLIVLPYIDDCHVIFFLNDGSTYSVQPAKHVLFAGLKSLGIDPDFIDQLEHFDFSKDELREFKIDIAELSLSALRTHGLLPPYYRAMRYEQLRPAEYFQILSIHRDAESCNHDTSLFPEGSTQLWKDLLMFLQDGKPDAWESLTEILLSIPLKTQEEFIRKAASDSIAEADQGGSMKPFGIPCLTTDGKQLLLAGQMYQGFSEETLNNWAIGLYGYEFRAEFPECLTISIDEDARRSPLIRLFSKSTLWPTLAEYKAWRKQIERDGYPGNSREMVELYGLPRGIDHLLMAIAEKENSLASALLRELGFNTEAARQTRNPDEDYTLENWHDLFCQAQAIAGEHHWDDTESIHLLLALLQLNNASVMPFLKEQGIDQSQLEAQLTERIKNKPVGSEIW